MRKVVIAVVFVLIAAVFGLRIYEETSSGAGNQGPAAAGANPGDFAGGRGGFGRGGGGGAANLLVETANPSMHVFNTGREFGAELLPLSEVAVIPRASGYLLAMLVDQADSVRRGQLLAEIDSAEIEQQIRRQEAALAVVESGAAREEVALENLRSQVERTHMLHEGGLVAREVVDDLESRLRMAEVQLQLALSQVDQAEASLAELKIQQELTRIYAPMDAVVAARHADPGALVGPNTPLLTIIDLSYLKSIVAVPEMALPDIQVGAPAEILFDTLPGRRYRGEVARMSPLVDTGTRSVNVEIRVANPEQILRPGMYARVRIGGRAAAPVLSIPRSALLTRGDVQGVYLLSQDQAAVFREIRMGRSEGGWVEVLDGLQPGDVFVTSGAQSLNEGDRVRLAGEEPPAAAIDVMRTTGARQGNDGQGNDRGSAQPGSAREGFTQGGDR